MSNPTSSSIVRDPTKIDKDSIYYQGSMTNLQSKQIAEISRDETFFQMHRESPKTQLYFDTEEFNRILSRYSFLTNKYVYRKIIEDARVLPYDELFEDKVNSEYNESMYNNFLNIYKNSPSFFDKLFGEDGKRNLMYKKYQLYIYLLCTINYIMTNYETEDFKNTFKEYEIYHNWAITKYSAETKFLIIGPCAKSSAIKLDFQKHYATLMDPSNVEGDITQKLQLETMHNIDSSLYSVGTSIVRRQNVYHKTPDYARSYTINLASMNLLDKYLDENDNLIFDLNSVDFGDTTSENLSAKIENMDNIKTTGTVSSRLSIKKLQEIFNQYSRFRIYRLLLYKKCFNDNLTLFKNLCINFDGVNISERNTYINEDNMRLKIPGYCREFNDNYYEFVPYNDYLTYRSERAEVRKCLIYMTDSSNRISAYNPSITIPCTSLFNYLILMNDSTDDHYNCLTLYNVYSYNYLNNELIYKSTYLYNSLYNIISILESKDFEEYKSTQFIDIPMYHFKDNGTTEKLSITLDSGWKIGSKPTTDDMFVYRYHYDEKLILENDLVFKYNYQILDNIDSFLPFYLSDFGVRYMQVFSSFNTIDGSYDFITNPNTHFEHDIHIIAGKVVVVNGETNADQISLSLVPFRSYHTDSDINYNSYAVSLKESMYYDPNSQYYRTDLSNAEKARYSLWNCNNTEIYVIFKDKLYPRVSTFSISYLMNGNNIDYIYLEIDNVRIKLERFDEIYVFTTRETYHVDHSKSVNPTTIYDKMFYNRLYYKLLQVEDLSYVIRVYTMGGYIYSDNHLVNDYYTNLMFSSITSNVQDIHRLVPLYGENAYKQYIGTDESKNPYSVKFTNNIITNLTTKRYPIIYSSAPILQSERINIMQNNNIYRDMLCFNVIDNYYALNTIENKNDYLTKDNIKITYYNLNEMHLSIEFT